MLWGEDWQPNHLGVMVCEANISPVSCEPWRRGGGSLVVGVWGEGQEWVTCNGAALHCGHSTLITPFTITATYRHHPSPPQLPERPGSTISTTTQMKWIIVSLCGISWDKRVTQEKNEDKMRDEERNCKREVRRSTKEALPSQPCGFKLHMWTVQALWFNIVYRNAFKN